MSERLSWSLWILGAALVIASYACVSPPDRLAVAVGLSNAAAIGLEAARREHEAHVVADYLARVRDCPEGEARSACVVAAGQATLTATGDERRRLVMLVLAQQAAASALEAAAACRRDGLACEGAELARAEAPLAQVRAGLARADGGAP